MKIRFSSIAVYKLERISEYLTSEWSEKTNQRFLNQLNSKLEAIKLNPKMCPESIDIPGLRKCVVSKQTTLLYEIYTDSIYVLTIFDSRQNPEKIQEELRKLFK